MSPTFGRIVRYAERGTERRTMRFLRARSSWRRSLRRTTQTQRSRTTSFYARQTGGYENDGRLAEHHLANAADPQATEYISSANTSSSVFSIFLVAASWTRSKRSFTRPLPACRRLIAGPLSIGGKRRRSSARSAFVTSLRARSSQEVPCRKRRAFSIFHFVLPAISAQYSLCCHAF